IAIEMEDDDGATRILIFDPKYKLDSEEVEGEIVDARPKKVDIDKMHAYRDAIRNEDARVVGYAAILYPGPQARPFGSGVDALSAVPGSAEPIQNRLRSLLGGELAERQDQGQSAA